MSVGIRSRAGTDLGLSVTGIAGPGGGTRDKPVGLVYIGLAEGSRTNVREELFGGSRSEIRDATANAALNWLIEYLQER